MATQGQKLLMAGTAVVVAEPVLALAHTGGVGAIVGLALGAIVYNAIEDVEKATGKDLSLPALSKPTPPGRHSLAYRLIHGKSVRGGPDDFQEEVEQDDADEAVGGGGPGPIFPRYRDDETLRLGLAIDHEALATLKRAFSTDKTTYAQTQVPGRRFEPHIDSIFGAGIILAAAQGSGKSMAFGLLAEQAGACDSPVIVLDHKGEYHGIAELPYLSGLLAGGPGLGSKAAHKGLRFFELNRHNVDEFVQKVISEQLQAVVSLPSFGERWIDRASIVAEIGQALMRYAARQTAAELLNLPCLVLLDEAQLYLPENRNLLPPEARQNATVLDTLSNAFFALVSNGRSNGYTMCFATQSLTYIAKWAIKSCQICVLLRHAEHNDLERCESIIGNNKAVASREDMQTLPPGVGVAFGFTPTPLLVRFDKRESRDTSQTPGVARLREHAARKRVSSPAARALEPSGPAFQERGQAQVLPALDIPTLTHWFANHQIDEATFLTLLKTVSAETPRAGTGNGAETASYAPGNAESKQAFPVSRPETAGVSPPGNSGNGAETWVETAPGATGERMITDVFPVSTRDAETVVTRSEMDQLGITEETIERIKKMKEMKYPDRDISDIMGMRGRRYGHYRKVLEYLGYQKGEEVQSK